MEIRPLSTVELRDMIVKFKSRLMYQLSKGDVTPADLACLTRVATNIVTLDEKHARRIDAD